MSGPLDNLEVPESLILHSVDVERRTAAGKDQSGAPVDSWTTVYKDLRCTVIPADAQDRVEFQQAGIEASHKVYFVPLSSGPQAGELPKVNVRDRLRFRKTRLFLVQWSKDEAEAGVVLTTAVLEEKRPA